MKIASLSLKNFRCFEDLTVTFSPQMNILIGNNASGKTTILDAAKYLLGVILEYQIKCAYFHYKTNDFRYVTFEKNKETTNPILLSCTSMDNFSWEDYILKPQIRSVKLSNTDFSDLTNRIKTGSKENLPLFAYYPINRFWNTSEIDKDMTEPNGSRFKGYENALENVSINIQKVTARIKSLELIEYQKGEKSSDLIAIKKAIAQCIPNCKTIKFNWEWDELYIYFENGESKPFSILSDGYRNTLAMVADIAYRCTRLNPYLENEVLTQTTGVVLIDELDLYLHPSWQKRIVGDLRKTFPNIQFIVTTHSPLIIASANENEVLSLDRIEENVLKADKQSYQAWQFENILKDVMSDYTPNQLNVTPILMRLNEALKSKNIKKFDAAFNELSKILHPNDSLLTVYEFEKIDLL